MVKKPSKLLGALRRINHLRMLLTVNSGPNGLFRSLLETSARAMGPSGRGACSPLDSWSGESQPTRINLILMATRWRSYPLGIHRCLLLAERPAPGQTIYFLQ